jgi:hypothetical protein
MNIMTLSTVYPLFHVEAGNKRSVTTLHHSYIYGYTPCSSLISFPVTNVLPLQRLRGTKFEASGRQTSNKSTDNTKAKKMRFSTGKKATFNLRILVIITKLAHTMRSPLRSWTFWRCLRFRLTQLERRREPGTSGGHITIDLQCARLKLAHIRPGHKDLWT